MNDFVQDCINSIANTLLSYHSPELSHSSINWFIQWRYKSIANGGEMHLFCTEPQEWHPGAMAFLSGLYQYTCPRSVYLKVWCMENCHERHHDENNSANMSPGNYVFTNSDNKMSCCYNMNGKVSKWHLAHWGRVMHIWTGNLTIIDSDNGLSPGWRQAIIWTNGRLLLIGPLGTNFSEILIEIHICTQENAFETVVCEMVAILSRTQCVKYNQHNQMSILTAVLVLFQK